MQADFNPVSQIRSDGREDEQQENIQEPYFYRFWSHNLLLYQILPFFGFKPVVFAFSQPAFGFGHANPIVKIIEGVKITFFDRKTNGFLGECSLQR